MVPLTSRQRHVSRWREEFAAAGSKFRIGIAWQGNPKHRWDRHRSFSLEYFQALALLPGVQFYSLQKGVAAEDLAHFSRRHGLIDLSGRLDDFTDTAAVMRNLDLVITCDSAPAHLAGSARGARLGGPVGDVRLCGCESVKIALGIQPCACSGRNNWAIGMRSLGGWQAKSRGSCGSS